MNSVFKAFRPATEDARVCGDSLSSLHCAARSTAMGTSMVQNFLSQQKPAHKLFSTCGNTLRCCPARLAFRIESDGAPTHRPEDLLVWIGDCLDCSKSRLPLVRILEIWDYPMSTEEAFPHFRHSLLRFARTLQCDPGAGRRFTVEGKPPGYDCYIHIFTQ